MRAAALALALAVACGRGGTPPAAPSNRGAAAMAITAEPGRSAGPIAIGMTVAEVRAVLGAPEVSDDSFLQYYRAGISVVVDGGAVSAMHLYRGVRGGYEDEPWRPFELRLPRGLGWDASEARVAEVLGAPAGTGELTEAPIPSRWVSYPGVTFDFRIDDGRMFHVVIAPP